MRVKVIYVSGLIRQFLVPRSISVTDFRKLAMLNGDLIKGVILYENKDKDKTRTLL